MRIPTPALVLVAGASLVLIFGGCRDEGKTTGRPAAAELSIKFRNEVGYPPVKAECLGEGLADSALSDEALRSIYNANLTSEEPLGDPDLEKASDEAVQDVGETLARCLGGQSPGTTTPPAATAPATTAPATTAPPVDSSAVPSTSAAG